VFLHSHNQTHETRQTPLQSIRLLEQVPEQIHYVNYSLNTVKPHKLGTFFIHSHAITTLDPIADAGLDIPSVPAYAYWHMPSFIEAIMSEQRHVSLFRNGRNQAVRIPREFELAGNETIMRQEGNRLIIEPLPIKHPLLALLETLEPIDEAFPDIEQTPLADEAIF
jgi:antitoxin VapB